TVRIHDEELAVGRIVITSLAGHTDYSALEGHLRELRLQVGVFRVTGAVAVLAVSRLRHETRDHPVERHTVIVLVASELLEARSMLRGDVVAQLDHDAALGGIDDQSILRIGASR